MDRLLKKFKAINYLDAITCKYIENSIDGHLNNKDTSRIDKYIEMIKFSSDFIKELDADLELEAKHSLNLSRIVAIQEQEIKQLKEKVKRLEKHYETKGL